MKIKLIILACICLLLSSCHSKSYKYIVVEKVELNTGYTKDIGKYIITIKDDYNAPFTPNHEFYTDSIYTAGDTLKLTK